MRVYYFGTFEKDYSRNIIFVDAMRSAGIDVVILNREVKEENALKYKQFSNLIKLGVKFVRAYLYLFVQLLKIKDSKYLFIGYPSHLDVIFFYLPAKLKGMKIFFNPLVSLYDTFVLDRKFFKVNSILSKIFYIIDKLAFCLSDVIFIDTRTHKEFIANLFKIDEKKFRVVPVGSMKEFFECKIERVKKKNTFTALYVGKYIPLHGVEIIVKSAKILEGENIQFIFVGKGQLYKSIREMVDQLGIKNIEFIEWVDRGELRQLIKSCHVVLGIFKGDGKAMRVVPNKVYDALACGSLVITANTPAVREYFKDKEELILVKPDDPQDLAKKILWVNANGNEGSKIAERGQKKFFQIASFEVLGNTLKEIIRET